MSEKFKAEMPPQEELVFQQTEGGAYNSFPSVEDVMEEMGIEDTGKEEILKYDQTLRGAYSSKPDVEDVLFELGLSDEKDNNWAQEAGDRGHGEYVNNVEAAVEYCKSKGVKTREEVEEILEKAETSTSYAEYAMDRGHGEYVNNVEKAAEFCKARGAKTKEDIEKILNEAKIEER